MDVNYYSVNNFSETVGGQLCGRPRSFCCHQSVPTLSNYRKSSGDRHKFALVFPELRVWGPLVESRALFCPCDWILGLNEGRGRDRITHVFNIKRLFISLSLSLPFCSDFPLNFLGLFFSNESIKIFPFHVSPFHFFCSYNSIPANSRIFQPCGRWGRRRRRESFSNR